MLRFCFLCGWAILCGLVPAWANNRAVPWQPPEWGPLELPAGWMRPPQGPITQYVVVSGRHLVTAGSDQRIGTPDDQRMRWWGINLAGAAAFPREADAARLAQTLASWGFNAVRLHYIDGPTHPDGKTIRSVLSDGPYPSFNPVAVGRLRHFMEQLRQHGIYIQLNPIAAHRAQPVRDGVPPLTPTQEPLPHNNPLAALHPGLLAQQKAYLQGLATALSLRQQPALAQVDLVNESSLLATWTAWNPDQWSEWVQGDYAQLLAKAWQAWVLERYGSEDKARAAWGLSNATPGPLPLPTPRSPEPVRPPKTSGGGMWSPGEWHSVINRWVAKLPANWQATLHRLTGASPVTSHPLLQDHLQFLADTDRRHLQALRNTLKSAIRADLPVAGTQASDGGGWNWFSHADMDFTDDHFYVDHYQFPGQAWDFEDWYVKREALSDQAWNRFAAHVALRDRSRPYVLSEFGQPYPNPLSAAQVLTLATAARQQDWDGLFLFDHEVLDATRTAPQSFDLQGDWPRALASAVASRLFLHGSLPASVDPSGVSAPPSPAELTAAWLTHRRPDYWQRSLSAGNRVPPLANTTDGSSALAPGLSRDGEALLWGFTPEVAWVGGRWVGGASGRLNELAWRVPPGTEPQEVTLALAAEGTALPHQGQRWLLAVLRPTMGSQPGTVPAQAQRWAPHPSGADRWTLAPVKGSGKPSASPFSVAPLWTETSPMELLWTSGGTAPEVWHLDVRGRRLGLVPLQAHPQGGWLIPLQGPPGSGPPRLWFEIISTQAKP